MEKLTLTPQSHEIVVNSGSVDGAVDLFSYGPETASDLKTLGSIYVVGYRENDSNNMGYMVSLIAALARREYYAQPGLAPRDAFSRTLKKINEVVEEFFQSSGAELSVGIFAIAGANIFVSKLDKFKILLARENQVIDILNNVMLFQKEHVQAHQFSSIISGTVQPGDKILAYYPSKAVTTRERFLKSYFLKLPYEEMAAKITGIGEKQATFAAALLYVDMAQTAEHVDTEPLPDKKSEPEISAPPVEAIIDDSTPAINLAWTPRQFKSATPASQTRHEPEAHVIPEPESEVPHLIATEFAMGTRQSRFNRLRGKLSIIRLDSRGKAIFLTTAVVLIVAAALIAKSILFTSPEERQLKQALNDITGDVKLANEKISAQDSSSARQILVRALASLRSYDQENSSVHNLSASILKTMDGLDNAQDVSISLVAQLDSNDKLVMAAWSSSSDSIWAVVNSDSKYALLKIADGSVSNRSELPDIRPGIVSPFKSGALVIDTNAKKIVRVMGSIKTFDIPTPDNILAASEYEGNIYVLTDRSILKISDLDTDKPVTKQWLGDVNELASGALHIYVNGNIYLMSRDGQLTTYYKGKKIEQVQTTVAPSGSWELVPVAAGLAVANADTHRIYEFDTSSGALTTTLKLDAQVSFIQMTAGPDGSVLLFTKDNKIWKTQ